MSDTPEPRRRYCLMLKIDREADTARVAEAGKATIELLNRWAKGEYELLSAASDYKLVSYVFATTKPLDILRADLERSPATRNADSFIIIELGELLINNGFSRVATWLQRH